MRISKALGVRAGTRQGIGTRAGKAGKGIGAGASAVGKGAKKAGEYVADRVDVEFDLKKAVAGGEEGYKRAKGGNLSRAAGALKGAVKEGGLKVTLRDEPRSKRSKRPAQGGRSRKPAARSARGSA